MNTAVAKKESYGAHMWRTSKKAIKDTFKVAGAFFILVIACDLMTRIARLLGNGIVKFYEVTSL